MSTPEHDETAVGEVSRIRWSGRRRGALAGLVIAVLAAAVGVTFAVTGGSGSAPADRPPAASTTAPSDPLVVQVAGGRIRGVEQNGVSEFLGVPFAAPPVGALRWKPPAPVVPWPGVRSAAKPPPLCAQLVMPSAGNSDEEDCLYLSVYKPHGAAPATSPKPVMLWIHGGSFVSGGAAQYDGSVLAAKGDVVVVTVNYRMGPFGFLALPALDSEAADGASGDYGLMDQQAAMRWVRANAAAFGGDPRNVTIFGESAGADSVCAAVSSPAAAGLFQRAIAESGCLLPTVTHAQALTTGGGFAAKLGCTDPGAVAACLRGKDAHTLLKAADESYTDLSWGPDVGGATLPESPAAAFAAGHLNHVPLIVGSNHDEARLFVALEYLGKSDPAASDYPAAVGKAFGPLAPQVLAHYPLAAYASPAIAEAAPQTDSFFSCPTLAADEALAKSTTVYGYEFDDPDAPPILPFPTVLPQAAAHSTEIPYVLQRTVPGGYPPRFTDAQFALSDRMIAYWSRFAATGDPNAPGSPNWPAYTRTAAADASGPIEHLAPSGISAETRFAADHQCGFWHAAGVVP